MASNSNEQRTALLVERVPALNDNYVWLLNANNVTAVVDPAEHEPVIEALNRLSWPPLTHILNTHHHGDHVGANLSLKQAYNLTIIGPAADKERIPGIDKCFADGDVFNLGGLDVKVFDCPGHTKGHIAFYVESASSLFPGDTLFALGCGRMFEGNPHMMWTSLQKFLPLPDETKVYCAHEYTQSNARFAVTVDPTNEKLRTRKEKIDELRTKGIPTVPSLLGEEKATNPFLRPFDPEIRKTLGMGDDKLDWEVFGEIRSRKDKF
jgi:hydroxyacylglutathione hydrolase